MAPSRCSAAWKALRCGSASRSAEAEGGAEGEGEGEGEGAGAVSEGGTKRSKAQTRMRRESCSTW